MLTAIVLELQPVNEAVLPISHGVYTYAAALGLIEKLAQGLSARIHDAARSKPLTVSPVWGASREGNILRLRRDTNCQWRLTGLEEEISACLLRISPDLGSIRIGDVIFQIASVHTDPCADPRYEPDVGQTTYEYLWEHWWAVKPQTVFPLEFLTPTTFRRGDYEDPFPAPHLVFGSILSTWSTYAPQKLDRDITAILKDMVILSNWRGETRRVELGSRRTVGFIGRFTYRAVENLPEMCCLLGLLAGYAFYSGAGWQTTHGMGQVRLAYNSY